MVLLFNVFLTSSKANQFVIYDRGNLPSHSKIEITKYSLSSLAKAYSWKRVIINIELDVPLGKWRYLSQEEIKFLKNL